MKIKLWKFFVKGLDAFLRNLYQWKLLATWYTKYLQAHYYVPCSVPLCSGALWSSGAGCTSSVVFLRASISMFIVGAGLVRCNQDRNTSLKASSGLRFLRTSRSLLGRCSLTPMLYHLARAWKTLSYTSHKSLSLRWSITAGEDKIILLIMRIVIFHMKATLVISSRHL